MGDIDIIIMSDRASVVYEVFLDRRRIGYCCGTAGMSTSGSGSARSELYMGDGSTDNAGHVRSERLLTRAMRDARRRRLKSLAGTTGGVMSVRRRFCQRSGSELL